MPDQNGLTEFSVHTFLEQVTYARAFRGFVVHNEIKIQFTIDLARPIGDLDSSDAGSWADNEEALKEMSELIKISAFSDKGKPIEVSKELYLFLINIMLDLGVGVYQLFETQIAVPDPVNPFSMGLLKIEESWGVSRSATYGIKKEQIKSLERYFR